MKRIRIKAKNIDKAATIIAEFILSKGLATAPANVFSVPVQVSATIPVLDCTLANSNASNVTLEAELTTEEQAEIEAEFSLAEQQAETAPLRLHGYRLLASIHREELEKFNTRHKAEFEEYRTAGDKFIPWTMESENLPATARAVHNQSPELWEEPLTKSQKRKRADQTAAATYRD